MSPKEPLGEDTVFFALKGSTRTYFEDTIISEDVDTAIYFRGSPGGGYVFYWSRENSNLVNDAEGVKRNVRGITGDPNIDTLLIEY